MNDHNSAITLDIIESTIVHLVKKIVNIKREFSNLLFDLTHQPNDLHKIHTILLVSKISF